MSHFFEIKKVVSLKTSDFDTDSDDKITLKRRGLCVVLFHDDSDISHILCEYFSKLQKEFSYVDICKCNMSHEIILTNVFNELSNDETSRYNIFSNHTIPFIIGYKDGIPIKLFIDVLDLSHITNFIIGLIYNK